MKRVVYTDPIWSIDPDTDEPRPGAEALEREVFGEEVELVLGTPREGRFALDGPELHDLLADADAVVVYRAQVDEAFLAAAGARCRVVARQGVGIDNLDLGSLEERAVYAFHVPDYCVDEVAAHTMALVLALERGVCAQDRFVKEDRWGILRGGVPRRLSDLTFGIVGFGRIGRATAARARVFFRDVTVYDPYVPADIAAGYGARNRDELSELMEGADAIVLHADLNDGSRGMIEATALASIHPGTSLVNTARGALVEPGAVLDALERGALGGYASDVFSPEDPNRDPVNRRIVDHPNVIVSSHRAFLSSASELSLRRRVAEEVSHVLQTGDPPRSGRLT